MRGEENAERGGVDRRVAEVNADDNGTVAGFVGRSAAEDVVRVAEQGAIVHQCLVNHQVVEHQHNL